VEELYEERHRSAPQPGTGDGHLATNSVVKRQPFAPSLSEGRHGQNPNLKEDAAMKNMFFSSKGKGNGVNTKNRCMGCIGDCETCPFKGVAEQINKAAEEGGPVVSEQQKDFDQQHESNGGKGFFPNPENLTPEEAETMKKLFYSMFDVEEEDDEKDKEKRQAPIMCKPYLVTIESIYHEYYGGTDYIIFRLETDEMDNVIKEPWLPHGSNADSRLDSLVFGQSLNHITHFGSECWYTAENGLELVQSDHNKPYNVDISYPVEINFMATTLEIDWVAIAAAVRLMESGPKKKKWPMVVFEVMKRNLFNEIEYFIGLPTIDIPARKI
jgi:hypothetical protein